VADNRRVLERMKAMVYEGWDILTSQRPLTEFGELLHESWCAKRSLDSGVSTADIDAMYDAGRRAGAIGGKLLGAGGGGFLLFFAPPERHARLGEVFADQQVLDVRCNAPGSEIIFASSTGNTRQLRDVG
jgi:D-glycero-alpha-D-manno-heptose-7-phosphate kinase